MKVVCFTPTFFGESHMGGGERYVLYLARAIAVEANGDCDVEIVSFGEQASFTQLQPGLSLRLLASQRTAEPLDVVSWGIPGAIEDADVVHVHQVFTRFGETAVLAAGAMAKPLCVTDHGGSTSTLGRAHGFLHLADRVVAYSEFGASLLEGGAFRVVIPGGVDGALFSPGPSGASRSGVLFVGRLMPHKGIDRLISALPEAVALTICGRPYHAEYVRHLKELIRERDVTFVTDATDDDLLRLYRGSVATVLPSVYTDMYGQHNPAPELMGLTLLESMACGTPVICSRVAGMPEFVEQGLTGFVYDSLDELSDYIQQLVSHPTLADDLGVNARHAVEERFDLRVAGARMLDLYRELAGASRRTGTSHTR